jgi:adenine-specific DNA methylase
MSTLRLIERWLPIAELGEESVRERRSMTALPPTYYLHVWWARRPLVASRAAILASLLPADVDHAQFLHVLGIHGDPIKTKDKIRAARKTGEDLGTDPYGYGRAFKYFPDQQDSKWLSQNLPAKSASVLDPTAGGGSIPFEAARLGLHTIGNDLNPVATIIEHATIHYPVKFGRAVLEEFSRLKESYLRIAEKKLQNIYPKEEAGTQVLAYLWARTIRCPYCEGLVPLSPNWRLASNGIGVRLLPRNEKAAAQRICDFEIVDKPADQSPGTVADGDATCPFPDCARVIDGDEVKRQAQFGEMGEQAYAVYFKRRIITQEPNGKSRGRWEKNYRAANQNDNTVILDKEKLDQDLPELEALECIPTEDIGDISNYERGHRLYGVRKWRDMFSSRQLLVHTRCVRAYKELYSDNPHLSSNEIRKAAFVYLALSLDKLLDYNSRFAVWMSYRQVIGHTFTQHNFSFKWSFAELPVAKTGEGLRWVLGQTEKCLEELIELARPQGSRQSHGQELNFGGTAWEPPAIDLSSKSGDALDHLADASVDCVVMDPPYYDNVMYAELSDFFYVWLKRTAGLVLPELFRRSLTDKENEAVANLAKFRDEKGAKALAGRDYQERMAAIFTECRRVLRPDGIMTLMFTHRATGAWDALTTGLMRAGFTITASWPINTEAESSIHIKDRAAANSTIFLACRPRSVAPSDAETQYWEDVEPLVAGAVRKRVAEFQSAGMRGVDLYLASFGPALEEFSKHWPLKRGTPAPLPPSRKRAQKEFFPEEWDPYAVSPEDALNAARREVKSWRLEQLTHKRARTELDPRTSWFVLAWDAFQAPVFPYDEALRLARAVGVDLDKDIVGSLANKKGSDLIMWDSVQRANKGALGSADGLSGMIDGLHHAAYQGRSKTLESARELLARAGIMDNSNFRSAMQAVLEVLPVGTAFSGVELPSDVAGAGNDFEAIEKLRRLAFADQVEEPQQLSLWQPTST